jgi:hypothetical protein
MVREVCGCSLTQAKKVRGGVEVSHEDKKIVTLVRG